MFKYCLYRFAQFLVNRLSLEASYALAVFLSDLHYFFSFRAFVASAAMNHFLWRKA